MSDDDWISLGEVAARVVAKQRPTFVLKIEYAGKAEFAMHGLRKLLKSLIRAHHFRCLSIEEVGRQQ
jgi:hypothetical protein